MVKKISLIVLSSLLILIVVALKMFDYNRDFLFQQRLVDSLRSINTTQQQILEILKSGPTAQKRAKKRPQRPKIDLNKVYDIDISNSLLKGDKQAKVTIVEFSDFQCPYSQKFHPIAMEAVEGYSDGVNYVFKSFPLPYHPEARPATKILLAAKEQGKYWEMLALLFENAKSLSIEKYQELAKQLDLDIVKFNQDLKEKDAQFEEAIEQDLAIVKSAEVRGTPSFYINGKITNARTVEGLKAEIDKILQDKKGVKEE